MTKAQLLTYVQGRRAGAGQEELFCGLVPDIFARFNENDNDGVVVMRREVMMLAARSLGAHILIRLLIIVMVMILHTHEHVHTHTH